MYPNEIAVVDEIFGYLSQITASPARQPSKLLTHVHVEAIIQILDRWPSSQRFPSTYPCFPNLCVSLTVS